MNSKKLSIQQERFCKEYLIDLNGTQAAIRAGYSKKAASAQASHLLSSDKVQNFLSELRKKIEGRIEITIDKVMQELAKIGFANHEEFLDTEKENINLKDVPRDKMAAVSSITVESVTTRGGDTYTTKKIKLWDKVAALEKLGRHLGGFKEDNKHVIELRQLPPVINKVSRKKK